MGNALRPRVPKDSKYDICAVTIGAFQKCELIQAHERKIVRNWCNASYTGTVAMASCEKDHLSANMVDMLCNSTDVLPFCDKELVSLKDCQRDESFLGARILGWILLFYIIYLCCMRWTYKRFLYPAPKGESRRRSQAQIVPEDKQ